MAEVREFDTVMEDRPVLYAADRPKLLAICVTTFQRPMMLRKCLVHLAKIRVPEHLDVALFVVDNDAEGSAREAFRTSRVADHLDAAYLIESERGLGQVRNRCLEAAIGRGAQLMAFIDDDEFPSETWLVEMVATMDRYSAQIVQGPVASIPWETADDMDLTSVTPNRQRKTGTEIRHARANNVLFDLTLPVTEGLRFDPFFRFVPGEDHDFFDRLGKLSGTAPVWCASGLVYELVPEERRCLRNRLKRSYLGAAANVLKFRRHHSAITTTGFYINRASVKAVTGAAKLLFGLVTSKKRTITGLRDLASAAGYVAGMAGKYKESYRELDGA